jgi:hypothetical protein
MATAGMTTRHSGQARSRWLRLKLAPLVVVAALPAIASCQGTIADTGGPGSSGGSGAGTGGTGSGQTGSGGMGNVSTGGTGTGQTGSGGTG